MAAAPALLLALVAPEVAEQADRAAPARQERPARLRRGFTLSPDGTGGVWLRGRLDAEAAATVTAALDPLAAPGRQVRIAADGHPEFLPPTRIEPNRRPRRNLLHRRN